MRSSLSCALGLVLLGITATAGNVLASECVNCHTDTAKLQAIAKTMPQKTGSAETAGSG